MYEKNYIPLCLTQKSGVQLCPGTSHQKTKGQVFEILRQVKNNVPVPKVLWEGMVSPKGLFLMSGFAVCTLFNNSIPFSKKIFSSLSRFSGLVKNVSFFGRVAGLKAGWVY